MANRKQLCIMCIWVALILLTGCVSSRKDNVPKVIVDCDMSYMSDDALALSMLLGEHEKGNIEILGITLEGGNTLIDASYQTIYATYEGSYLYTTDLLEKLGFDNIPIYRGTDIPAGYTAKNLAERSEYFNTLETLLEWDNNWGALHYFGTIEKNFTDSNDATDFMLSQIKSYPDEVVILAIGPVMNIAKAIEKDSSFAEKVKAIYFMCGAFGDNYEALDTKGCIINAVNGANVSAYSEYNAVYDPVSLEICLSADFNQIYISPGELNVYADQSAIEMFKAESTGDSSIVKLWADLYETSVPEYPYWDPLAVAAFLNPESAKIRNAYVSIETDISSPYYGMTTALDVEDYSLMSETEKSEWSLVGIITEVSDFWETVMNSIK